MASRPSSADPKLVAAFLSCLLASMLVLAAGSEPPRVAISSLGSVEEGTPVRVSGLLVSLWRYDSGDESLVLADPSDGATADVRCAGGRAPLPSTYLHIGDELLVEGELTESGRQPVITGSADGIERLRQSETALSVRVVCLFWLLFEGDRFNLTGIISADGQRLEDLSSGYSIPLRFAAGAAVPSAGVAVRADCLLILDESQVLIYLLVWGTDPA